MLTVQVLVVGLVALQRLAELALARRHDAALRAAGAVETGARHYPLFAILHGSWLATLIFWPGQTLVLPLLAGFALLQAGRVWVLLSLGRRWTTRILVLPGVPLVTSGPYRLVRHPNYMIVTLEIAVLPLAFGLWPVAIVFSVANAALLWHRIRLENRALAQAPGDQAPGDQTPGDQASG